MKYVLFFLALVFFGYSAYRFGKAKNTTEVPRKDTVMTTCRFSTILNDLGESKLDSNVKPTFRIYNTGPNKLYVENILPDCHCTTVSYKSTAIEPNDSADIVFKFEIQGEGPYQASATVSTNTPTTPTLLIFRGSIVKR